MVKQIGGVYIYENYEEGPEQNPLFSDKIVIVIQINPNPERSWPTDEPIPTCNDLKEAVINPTNAEMIAYIRAKNNKLLELGILTEESLQELKNQGHHSFAAAKFPDLETAIKIFEQAVEAGIVDIYLYDHCSRVRKYD